MPGRAIALAAALFVACAPAEPPARYLKPMPQVLPKHGVTIKTADVKVQGDRATALVRLASEYERDMPTSLLVRLMDPQTVILGDVPIEVVALPPGETQVRGIATIDAARLAVAAGFTVHVLKP